MFGIGQPGPDGRLPVAWSVEQPPRASRPGFVHRPHPHMDVPLHLGMHLPVIQTRRLTMCGLTGAYLEQFNSIQHDPRIAEWFGGLPDPLPSPQRQREDTWRVMAALMGHWALRGYGQWALVERATHRFVGRAGLWNPEGWPGVEVGWLVDPEVQGLGYATEAGRAAVDFAFDRLELDEVISVTVPHNVRSRRVMEKLGLADTGTTVELRDHTQVLYRITREEWLAQPPQEDPASP